MTTSDGSTRNLADTNAQPAPQRNDKPAVWSLVMRDMTERDIFGAEKYGTRLQPGNGRDFLLDAYQEALDLVVYLRGAIYERDELATVKESLRVWPAHIDPADVDISEQPDKCKGCFAGCRDCCPGLAKLQDEKLARMRADSAEQFINEVYDRIAEPASAIDDDSERMQAIGQNGEMADEVYAAVDAKPKIYGLPSWSDAPEWAEWLAMDGNGEWYWYERPIRAAKRRDLWKYGPISGAVESAAYSPEEVRPDWRTSLQARPEK